MSSPKRSHRKRLATEIEPAPAPVTQPDPTPPSVVVTEPTPTGFLSYVRAFFAGIWAHLTNWPEIYVALPVAIVGMIALVKFSHFLLGRKPLDEGYDFVGLGFRFFTCVLLVIGLSFAKQSGLLGAWKTKEEQLLSEHIHWSDGVFTKLKTVGLACLFAYILLH